MLLNIYTLAPLASQVAQIIGQEPRLGELVGIRLMPEYYPVPDSHSLIVDEEGIIVPLDWYNETPPFQFAQPLAFTGPHLLGLVYARLSNYQRAYELLARLPLLVEVDLLNRLQHGATLPLGEFTAPEEGPFARYRAAHNQAVLMHYGQLPADLEEVKRQYHTAGGLAPNDELRAYTARHYAALLADHGQWAEAEQLLPLAISYALSDEGKIALKDLLYHVWLAQLTVPYHPGRLEQLKTTLWEVFQFYEQNGKRPQLALALTDAAHVANLSNSFAEALGYINRAIQIFAEEELPELLANAQLRKGTLLYTWAQGGQPQFYRPAMEAYQEALKQFTKETQPDIFADIHHNLGVIYSEIPDEAKKKSIWASVSTTSFREALLYYNKEQFPYEYAMICNNYGNALTKYPAAVKTDNYARALEQYDEALSVRSAAAHPYERALTLLNYLEAAWFAGHNTDQLDPARYATMLAYAQEIPRLVDDASLRAEAARHLEKLELARQALALT
ncbi:MAG: hypothetical protein MUC97_08220 [Bernardetiaceae bacterium]|jgi:tetratricopeptide (TPR) repeat protein|nr:hypothetical protein [Bernardetiaceae bacterium]